MYNISILTKCENEQEISAVITAALSIVLEQKTSREGLIVKSIRRIPVSAPEWSRTGRYERFECKLNR